MAEKVLDVDEARLTKLAVFGTTAGVDRHRVSTSERGTKVVHSIAVFKAGSFKDSLGEQQTWTQEQLAMMASNFTLLRAADLLAHVPVRTDHSWSVEKVVGYIEAVHVEGDRLMADVEFTEPDAFDKFDRGTFRSRSIEIGMYEDNNGVTYWPVVLGLAFVDIPAVEGLHRGSQTVGCFRYQGEENPSVPDKTDTPFTFRINGADETDYGKVQAYVAQLEGDVTALRTRNEALESFAKEQATRSRHNFVTGLAEAKKIAATQVDGLKVLVETMTDEQFTAFMAAYEKAPTLSLLGDHGNGVSNPENASEQPEHTEVDDLKEIVAMHRRAGMTDDEVAKTSSYRKLVALTNGK